MASPVSGRTINFDPSVVGLAGAISDVVYDGGGVYAWRKYGTGSTQWLAIPVSSIVTADPTQAPGLKAPIGYIVYKSDGTAVWSKTSSSDTGWTSGIGGGGSGLTPIADQTVLGNISGSAAAPSALSAAQILTLIGVTPFADARAATMIRAQALCGATLNVINGTEFDKPGEFVSNPTGSGIGLVSASLGSGVVRVGTGATASSQGKVSLGGASALGAQIADLKSGRWYCYFRAKLATAIDSLTTMELMLNASTGNSMLAVGVGGGTSTSNWRIRTFDHAGNPWIATAAIAQAIDTNWHDVEFYNDGTNVTVLIDTVQQAQLAAASIVQGDPLYMQVTASNSTTAANREWNIDRMFTVTPSN